MVGMRAPAIRATTHPNRKLSKKKHTMELFEAGIALQEHGLKF